VFGGFVLVGWVGLGWLGCQGCLGRLGYIDPSCHSLLIWGPLSANPHSYVAQSRVMLLSLGLPLVEEVSCLHLYRSLTAFTVTMVERKDRNVSLPEWACDVEASTHLSPADAKFNLNA
jgi:hypothetical protein